MKDHGQNERKLLDCTEGVLGSGNPMVPVSPVEMDRGSCWWSPRCLELGDIGGRCGLLDRLGCFHRG